MRTSLFQPLRLVALSALAFLLVAVAPASAFKPRKPAIAVPLLPYPSHEYGPGLLPAAPQSEGGSVPRPLLYWPPVWNYWPGSDFGTAQPPAPKAQEAPAPPVEREPLPAPRRGEPVLSGPRR